MSTPILTSKLYIPPTRLGAVIRRRLLERLNEGVHRKLTLISAPAGFGKTTLMSGWAANCGRPIAWLSLDEEDNAPIRFLVYLVSALQMIAPNTGAGMLAVLQSPQPPPIEAILTALLNEIAAISDQFVLVLDDYHLVETQSLDQMLTFFLEHLPRHMHLVIATREDPQFPLARYRARGQLTELRAPDLRFTGTEAAQFLNRVMGLNLLAEDIAALEARTEGWIAGLQLAALSMQRGVDTTSFIQAFTGSHRFVLDYLTEEVLQRQPEAVRDFLLQTSILSRLSGPLCDAVTGQHDGHGTLKALERGNLFVVTLDDQRQWYRYHHLFADVLQARVMEDQRYQVSTLHQRASLWYEQNGLPFDAIQHALAAEDFERAAGMIEMVWSAMEGSFQSAVWFGWVKALPDNLVRTRPVLSVWYAYALLNSGDMEAAETRLKDAERWLEPRDNADECPDTPSFRMVIVDEEQFRSLPALIATARAYRAQALGDVPGAVKYARQILELIPEGDHLRRDQASTLLGLAYWSNGDLEAANRIFTNYMMKLRTVGDIAHAISPTFVLADIRMALGRLREADLALEQLLQIVLDQGEPLPVDTAELYRGLSELHRERGDLNAASQHLLKSKELSAKSTLLDWQRRLCLAEVRLKQTRGDLDGALNLLDEADRFYIRTPLPDVSPTAALRARIWVAQGKLPEAFAWARERTLSTADDLSYLREFEHITLARMLIARYKIDQVDSAVHEAMELLEGLLQAAEAAGRIGSIIEILVLQALAYEAQGNLPPALMFLERALTLAQPEGDVRVFVDEGTSMAHLLSSASANGIILDYGRKLLAAIETEQHMSADKLPVGTMVDSLTLREQEVLRLMGAGLSNPEIAATLVIAVTTVKTHIKNTYEKLQVTNRFQAIARAKELGLL
ncbi:MAG: helix-turn-helix transcriptional regulator [Anaerolineae bacterium]|nr:helix-turn-helix transcriptional regulator [Anaerolineae bacterium]